MDGRPDGAVGDGFLQKLLIVVRGGDIAGQEQVGVVVDQAGKDRGGAEVDYLGAGGDWDGASNGFYAIFLDEDVLVRQHTAGADVDQTAGFDQDGGRLRGLGEGQGGGE